MGLTLVSNIFFGNDAWSFSGCTLGASWLILLFYIIYKVIVEKPWTEASNNRYAIANTQQKRNNRFAQVKKRLENLDVKVCNEILTLTFFKLRDALQSGKYSAQNVLLAYSWKALQIQDQLNCISEFLIESFDDAELIDKTFENSNQKPPLYGIPFSVKGNFFIKGYDCCIGLAQWLDDPKTKECTFVTQLRRLGAIPFVMTNVPQTLISYVCSNPVYGQTGNPYNAAKTPGGSSGGEACLLAAGGTPFAIGGDLAGSLRIPANFCGVYTIKPTQDRFVVDNVLGGVPGRGRLGLSYGFFTKSIEEQNFLLKLVLGTADYKNLITRYAPSLPFNTEIYEQTIQNKALRIGYFSNDGFLKPVPGCERAVIETVEKLKAKGFELVKFDLPNSNKAANLLFKAIFPDGGTFFSNLFAHDIIDDNLKHFAFLLKVPKFLRLLIGLLIAPFSPQAAIMARSYVKTAEDVTTTNHEIDEYIKHFTDTWKELQIDALVCPSFAVPPVPHSYPSKLGACAFSTALFNMLDYTAGVVPTRKVTKQDDLNLKNESYWQTNLNFVLKLMRSAAADSEGLPLSVQVVTLPFEEEKCLGVMKIVDELWKTD